MIRVTSRSSTSTLAALIQNISASNFGVLIAYLIPGFTTLWGISFYSETVRLWLGEPSCSSPTVGGFLYVTLASIGAGMIVNGLRWLTLDHLHHRTGVCYPDWDFANLQPNLGAYDTLVAFYYRYHEFFGNSLVAGTFTYLAWRWLHPGWRLIVADGLFLALAFLLWVCSRDTLKKYYERSSRLLSASDHVARNG